MPTGARLKGDTLKLEVYYGESFQSFCVKNKVPYNLFQKWFKNTRKKIVEVQIDDIPVVKKRENLRQVTNI